MRDADPLDQSAGCLSDLEDPPLPEGIPTWLDLALWAAAGLVIGLVLSVLSPWGFATH